MRPAVAYIRVSKPKQGRSGLGLEAQQAAIKAFCAQHGYKVEAEYREVETGKGADALGMKHQIDPEKAFFFVDFKPPGRFCPQCYHQSCRTCFLLNLFDRMPCHDRIARPGAILRVPKSEMRKRA